MKEESGAFGADVGSSAVKTTNTPVFLNSLRALRRYGGVGFLLIATLAVTACGDEDEPEEAGAFSAASDAGSPPQVSPSINQAPWIAGTPRRQAMVGQQYSFRPGAGDPEGEMLSFRAFNAPAWASFNPATGLLSGTPRPENVGSYTNIDIEVSDGDKSSRLGSFTIQVVSTAPGSISLSWIPATQRVDGSPLTNLQGHRIHWGTQPGNYTESVFVDGAGITAYVIDDLVPASYYIAATTVDANGLESDFSDPVTVTLR